MFKYVNILMLFLFLSGCSSYINPSREFITADEASFDNNEQTSGILEIDYGRNGYIVTPNFIERYNNLMKYNDDIIANLKKNDGVLPINENKYFIDKQHMSYFLLLNDIKKQQNKK